MAPSPDPPDSAPALPGHSSLPPTKTNAILWLKEVVAAVLALAISGSALWMLLGTYNAAAQEIPVDERVLDETQTPLLEAQERARLEQLSGQKDILLVAIGLFGSVLGYYFGRVPAEHRAERAESAAAAAEATANTAVASASAAEARAGGERQEREKADRKVEDACRTTEAILPTLSSSGSRQRRTLGAERGSGGADAGPTVPAAAAAQLQALLDRLR